MQKTLAQKIQSDFAKAAKHFIGFEGVTSLGSKVIQFNCRIGKQYCKPGTVCRPVEGSFVTECEVKGCKQFN